MVVPGQDKVLLEDASSSRSQAQASPCLRAASGHEPDRRQNPSQAEKGLG